MSGSSSGVVTALVGGGFAVVGFVAAGWQNSRTIRANRESSREGRLWDKKTALYEAISGLVEDTVGWLVKFANCDPSDVHFTVADHAEMTSLAEALKQEGARVKLYAGSTVAQAYLDLLETLLMLTDSETISQGIPLVPNVESRLLTDVVTAAGRLDLALRSDLQGTALPRFIWADKDDVLSRHRRLARMRRRF